MTNRRVNALEHVVIPRLENTISYINSECAPPPSSSLLERLSLNQIDLPAAPRLDEMDREEFFRLKKIQSKKKRDNAAREKEDAAKRAADEEAKYGSGAAGGGGGGDEEGGGDLLNERDEDGASVALSRSRRASSTTCAPARSRTGTDALAFAPTVIF